jgi:hypothetical protein
VRPERLVILLSGVVLAVGAVSLSAPDLDAAGAAALPSNGVAAATPGAIIADARSAVESASTVHVSGTMISGAARISVDIEMVTDKGGYGTFTATQAGRAASYQLVTLGGDLYIKGDRSFWALGGASSTVTAALQGRWVKESAAHGDNAVLASILTARTFFAGALALHGTLAKLSTSSAMGQPVVPVTNGAKTGIIYVATTGKPYPVEITVRGAKGGTLVVSRVDQPASVTAPANAISGPAS